MPLSSFAFCATAAWPTSKKAESGKPGMQEIKSTVRSRTGKVQLLAAHLQCGGWTRGKGKKGEAGYHKADLPGTWTLSASAVVEGQFFTMGPHLKRLGMREPHDYVSIRITCAALPQ